MMRRLNQDSRETLIGAAVIAVLALALLANAADRKVRDKNSDGYPLEAVFDRSDGLAPGAEVRVAGVPVGSVVHQTLDDNYRIHLTLQIARDTLVPVDSAAIIETDGLLGSKYIELQPGGEEDFLPSGGRLRYTQGSLVIEDLLAKIVGMAHARRAKAAADQAKPGVPPQAPKEQ